MPRPAEPLPYGRQTIDPTDIDAVVEVLRSDWLTTGPMVERFERSVAEAAGQEHAVAFCNGTASLHGMMFALGVGPGDEVIVPATTFVASGNCALYQGAKPVVVDVEPETLLLDPEAVAQAVTDRTRAVMAVDFAGQPCDYPRLQKVCDDHDVVLLDDAAHSLGGALDGRPVGSLAHMSNFSFHPVKPVTSGEGGMVVTDDGEAAAAMRRFRNHGLSSDHRERAAKGTFAYGMHELGYNYRLSDIHSALGESQMQRLAGFVQRRQAIAAAYDAALRELDDCTPLAVRPGASHAYHLYVVRIHGGRRDEVYRGLRDQGILANVHYLPLNLQPYYQKHLGMGPGMCPNAEAAYEEILSLPIFPTMPDGSVERVVAALRELLT